MASAQASFGAREPVEAQGLVLAPYSSARTAWPELIGDGRASSLYHSPRWLELIERAFGWELNVVALADRGRKPSAALIYASKKRLFSRRAVALPFSDYGGPLAFDQADADHLLILVAARVVRDAPPFAGKYGLDSLEIRGFEAPAPYRVVRCFQNWELDLTRSLPALERGLDGNFRRAINKARRAGVRVVCGNDLEFLRRFYAMHLKTRRRLGVPVQPFGFFELARKLFGADLEVWLAVEDGRDACGLVLIRHGERVYYKWGARDERTPSSNANHLLLWSVVEAYAGKAAVLDCGRADIRNEGLSRFKRHLGARAIPLPYAFLPEPAREISAEVSSGAMRKLAASLWRRLPIPLTRALSAALYRALG